MRDVGDECAARIFDYRAQVGTVAAITEKPEQRRDHGRAAVGEDIAHELSAEIDIQFGPRQLIHLTPAVVVAR